MLWREAARLCGFREVTDIVGSGLGGSAFHQRAVDCGDRGWRYRSLRVLITLPEAERQVAVAGRQSRCSRVGTGMAKMSLTTLPRAVRREGVGLRAG